ncbi:hypothetical protein C2W64_04827 [Brevibacillus laterosporus]|nr:hypothetical protein C2W64_04827 [Brevibacillus laterosporus]
MNNKRPIGLLFGGMRMIITFTKFESDYGISDFGLLFSNFKGV